MMHERDVYDFIVCGSGSSGSVVAARLAENPEVRVLLIEAGGSDDVADVMTPLRWLLNLGSERDWAFQAQPNPHLNGRAIPLNMGKVLGGGSSINGLIWARGHKNDWEDFAAEADDPNWGYDSVLRTYRRIEDWQGAADPRRGVGGPVFVQPSSDPRPVALALLDAGRNCGMPTFESPNGEMMEGRGGVALTDLIVRDGKRSSMFRSYVHPRMRQTNLTVVTHTFVSRLLFAANTVVGVEVIREASAHRYFARHEVILSLGAINTPKVLMQSGIGPEAELRRHGINVVQDLPGVGQNHQDHVAFGCVFESREPLEQGHQGCEATLYWKSESTLRHPDVFHCQGKSPMASPESARGGLPAHGWTIVAGLAHPKSRGCLKLSGPNVWDPVLIEANFLADPDDVKAAMRSVDLAREIGNDAAFRPFVQREALPGACTARELEVFLRNAATTYWHQSCTAKMGRDAMAVVDNRLKVYGVEGLRIADASIMPHITSGNIMAPCVVIGEKAAEMIKASYAI